MKHYENTGAFDRTVKSLCNQIDSLEKDVAYWRDMYEKISKENSSLINESLAKTKQDLGNAILFALSVKDDADGNLVIAKEDRKVLADQYRDS